MSDEWVMVAFTSHGPLYLEDFDVDAFGGLGQADLTKNLDDALRFESSLAVFEAWTRQSTVMPLRADGKPNKPLTAFTIEPFHLGTTRDPDDITIGFRMGDEE